MGNFPPVLLPSLMYPMLVMAKRLWRWGSPLQCHMFRAALAEPGRSRVAGSFPLPVQLVSGKRPAAGHVGCGSGLSCGQVQA